jgi:hypothetical protein
MSDRYAPHGTEAPDLARHAATGSKRDRGSRVAAAAPAGLAGRMMDLQRTAGNQAVVQRLASRGAIPAIQRVVEVGDVEATPATEAGPEGAGAGSGGTEINDTAVRVNAGTIDLNAPIVRVAGIVQADTIIADSVVASSYTPGAGNAF